MPGVEEVIAGIMLVSLIFYALFGGADFGGGVWDLLAFGPRADRQRDVIAKAIGPIWEANHVWLVLVVVILFTGFPPAFSALMTALHVPITIMLIGIVLRGAAFAFRSQGEGDPAMTRRWGRVFAIASLFTPIWIGVVAGAISSGRIGREPDGVVTGGFVDPWLTPFAFAVGGFAVTLFAFLAAVYLTVETDDPDLQEDFRVRALLAAIGVGGFALLVFVLSDTGAPVVREHLAESRWAIPTQLATGTAAVTAIVALWQRHYALARTAAVAQVACILLGWGVALYPNLVVPAVTIDAAAAPRITLQLLLGGLIAGSLILFPALFYLYRIFKGAQAFQIFDRSPRDTEQRTLH